MTARAAIKQKDFSQMDAQEGRYGYVYFIADPDAGMIKVGWANDISKRLESLQTGNPRELEVHYAIKTVPFAERVIQKALNPYHAVREWYRHCGDIIDLIEEFEIYQGTMVSIHHEMTKDEIIEAIEEGYNKPFLAADIESVLNKWRAYIDA